jgi:hypothetical protein
LNVAPGFLVDGITKDMFIMNGMKPKFLWLDYSWSEGCPQICLLYELPVFHEHTSEWKNDATNHWNECACGDKTNVAAHADTNNDKKCDTCGYEIPAQAPGTDPGNTPNDPNGDKDGLGAGAIVAIVIGAVLVVGIGGFAIFWFVIKKKSFADLIAVFKKN